MRKRQMRAIMAEASEKVAYIFDYIPRGLILLKIEQIEHDNLRCAFVIKKGAYEKLVCQTCRFAGVWPFGAPDCFTPVTLTCVAHCSHCDEAI
jgi:hypothetical protein